MNQMGKNMQQEGKQVFTASTVDKMKTDLDLGQWTEAEKIILTCRMLAMESHSETLAGQITIRGADGTFLTTPMAIRFDAIEARHVIRIHDSMNDRDGDGMLTTAGRLPFGGYCRRAAGDCI